MASVRTYPTAPGLSGTRRCTRLASRLSKAFYWPLCRYYARRFVGNAPADRCFTALSALQYRIALGQWPNLREPRRLSEKLWCRMLFARDPLLTLISDKYEMRQFVAERIGEQHLVPLLWYGTDPEQVPFDELPERFVVKATHGCGYNIIVTNRATVSRLEVVRQLRVWLTGNFCDDRYLGMAWGYKNVKPAIVIETFLEEGGRPPADYKFYCFSGRVEFVTIHIDRFGGHYMVAVDPEFRPYSVSTGHPSWAGDCVRPNRFDDMVRVAERLAADFNFVRVDLYAVGERIYCGEMTPYPKGVAPTFYPDGKDIYLGSLWQGPAETVRRS